MNTIAKSFPDILKAVLLGAFLYLLLHLAVEDVEKFISNDENRFLLLTGIIAIVAVLISPKILMFIQKIYMTYQAIGYQSSTGMTFIFGIFFTLVAAMLANESLPMVFRLLGIFIALTGVSTATLYLTTSEEIDELPELSTDLLERKQFVDKICNLIESPDRLTSKSRNEALVIWIASHWGSGKTWTLREVQKKFHKSHSSETVVWFSFNPWLHSSANPEAALVEAFFEQLAEEISKHFYLEGLNKKIASYTQSILSQGGQRIFGFDAQQFLSSSETTEDIKAHISDFLLKSNIKLVISFDEIDRLTPPEMVTCLKIIRSLASFANTIILVCGAPEKVEDLLGKAGLPKDYLEKIA